MCLQWSCAKCDLVYNIDYCTDSLQTLCCGNYEVELEGLCGLCRVIGTPVCDIHGICFCKRCRKEYRDRWYQKFNNVCDHENAQCIAAASSGRYITTGELISLAFK